MQDMKPVRQVWRNVGSLDVHELHVATNGTSGCRADTTLPTCVYLLTQQQ